MLAPGPGVIPAQEGHEVAPHDGSILRNNGERHFATSIDARGTEINCENKSLGYSGNMVVTAGKVQLTRPI